MSDTRMITLNDGNTMPQLGLGVWKAADGAEVVNAVQTALESGYRMIDTAMVYQNERGVGEGIQVAGLNRDDIFITTKLWNSDQGSETVRPALEASLERLGLDYVDLYLIHWPTPARDLFVETWKEFIKLKDSGLTRSIGVSNFRIEDLERLKEETGVLPTVNQIELHPYFQQRELREYADKNNIRIESWSPIGGSKGKLLEDTVITDIAKRHQKSAAQIVIRWHIQHGLIVIPKSVNENRIKENLNVFDFELSDDDMSLLDGLDRSERYGPDPTNMNTH